MPAFSRSTARRANNFYVPNRSSYDQYYARQAGAGGAHIPKFVGAGSRQFGYGLGSLLRSFWRTIVPIGRRVVGQLKPIASEALTQAKPLLKEAAVDVARETAKKIGRKLTKHLNFDGDEVDHVGTSEQTGGRRRRKRKATAKKPSKRTTKPRTKADFIRGLASSAGPSDIF